MDRKNYLKITIMKTFEDLDFIKLDDVTDVMKQVQKLN
jgi:hypothetical protein